MKNRPKRLRKPHQGDPGQAKLARRQHQEQVLDDALKNTFPASDPVSIIQPAPPAARLRQGEDPQDTQHGRARSVLGGGLQIQVS
jgi:hypothetical protein